MNDTLRCQQCDSPLPGQAVGGLCANCLLRLALEPPALSTGMGDDTRAAAAEAMTVRSCGGDRLAEAIPREPAAPLEAVGSRIGRYKLLQEIGEGGFGVVYLADQLEPVKRRVALKVLKPGMDTREVIARFEAERQALALMDHPNIARVFDGGATDSGRPYFVMELVKGIPLTKYCDDQQLNTRQRLDLFLDVLAAVQHAHQKSIIHRDLKPANILVSPHDGRPVIKVIDFGIAKAISLELTDKTLFTAHGRMIGTPQYMSPEQAEINALDVDTRSDLYSLGVILYELLTGRTPLDAKILRAAAYAEIQRLIREEEPPKPSTRISTLGAALPDVARQRGAEPLKLGRQVSGDLDWIVMKALEKDRSRRYETANGFAADVRRHLENEPVTARPPGAGYLLSRFVRRHKFGFAAAAAVSMALLAGIAGTTRGLIRETAARKTAQSETTNAIAANKANKHNLHLASMADFASAVKALDEDSAAALNHQHAIGFAGKTRWHEGVVLLTRSLERDPGNTAASFRLYETLRSRQAEKRDWPVLTIKHGWNAAFSPDGSRIATAGPDSTARVWDAKTGMAIGEPLQHKGTVYCANFSPDGARIVTASYDHTAQMWDAVTGKRVGATMHHAGYVEKASFSPDGTKVVTSGEGDTAQVWDAQTGWALGDPLRHESKVHSTGFSPDGTKVITASEDKSARVWDAATGRPLAGPLPHEGGVRWASFSPDGARIVTACGDKTARVWDGATGQPLGEPMHHEGPVTRAVFSPDGTRIVTSSADKTARVWDAATGQPVARFWNAINGVMIGEPMSHKSQPRADFSPDGTRIITTAWETAQVWDTVTGQSVGCWLPHAGLNGVHHAAFSPDGTRIVTSSGGTVQVWDAASPQAIEEPVRGAHMLKSASFSPDGARIVTVGDSARVWDTATRQEIGSPLRPDPGNGTNCATFSPDGSRLVIATFDKARVWDVATSQAVGEPMRHKGQVSSVAFSPDGRKIVSAGYDRTAMIWDAGTGRPLVGPLRHEIEEGILVSAAFCPLGTRIVTVDGHKTSRVWDAATGQPIGQPIRGPGYASFSPDGSKLVTTSVEGPALVWDAATGQAIGKPLGQNSRVNSARFSPDGGEILTVSEDGNAMVWDILTGRAVVGPLRHQREVISAEYSPDGTRIVTSGADQTARVWDSFTGQALGEPMRHEYVFTAQFSPDGTKLLTVCEDHAAIWNILTKAESEGVAEITPEVLGWVRHFAGLRFSEDGELRLIPAEERIAAISNVSLPAGPWADLASWINTPTPRRTIDPNSKSTLRQIAERERDFDGNGTVDSLESALRYDPTVPLARLLLAAALERANSRKGVQYRVSNLLQRAAFLRRYDLDALARETGRMKNVELAALWVRAAKHLLELPADTKIGVGPKPTTARDEAAKAARKALELVPGMPAATEVLEKF